MKSAVSNQSPYEILRTTWYGIHHRCNPCNASKFPYHAAIGITVCKRWNKLSHFMDDMGYRPSTDHSLDRINPFGNYEPSNCRWTTGQLRTDNTKTQLAKKLLIPFRNTTLTANQIAKLLRIHPFRILQLHYNNETITFSSR